MSQREAQNFTVLNNQSEIIRKRRKRELRLQSKYHNLLTATPTVWLTQKTTGRSGACIDMPVCLGVHVCVGESNREVERKCVHV